MPHPGAVDARVKPEHDGGERGEKRKGERGEWGEESGRSE